MAINKRLIKSNDEGGGVVPTSFNTVLYTGNGGTLPVTDVGFQPDFVWAKSIGVENHILTDSVRGVNSQLFSNLTNAESTLTTRLQSFDATGFTLGDSGAINNLGTDYVAWCWKAGGAAVTNTDGTITSQVSANVDAGFSIVSYTGNGTQPSTIGHGLGLAPKIVINKCRSLGGTNWHVYSSDLGATSALVLNDTAAAYTGVAEWGSDPSSSVLYVNNTNTNFSGRTYISYCFAEVAGFSKFGSYVGSDNNVVTTEFEPAFVLIKSTTNAAGGWNIFDNKRGLQNRLFPNFDYAESPDSPAILNFTPTGFSFNTRDSWTNGSHTYIYMAFANQF